MTRIARAFWSEDESKAAIDWAVLMAGVLSLVFAVAASVLTGPGGTELADVPQPVTEASDA